MELNSWNASSVEREVPQLRKFFDVPFIIVTMQNGKYLKWIDAFNVFQIK